MGTLPFDQRGPAPITHLYSFYRTKDPVRRSSKRSLLQYPPSPECLRFLSRIANFVRLHGH
jgi:hypothetical protein